MSNLSGLLRDCVTTNFGQNADKHEWEQKPMFLQLFVEEHEGYKATESDWERLNSNWKKQNSNWLGQGTLRMPWERYRIEHVEETQKMIEPVVVYLGGALEQFNNANFYDAYMIRDRQVRDWDDTGPLSDEDSARLRASVEKQVREILDRLQRFAPP
jgi:hypothetical protein